MKRTLSILRNSKANYGLSISKDRSTQPTPSHPVSLGHFLILSYHLSLGLQSIKGCNNFRHASGRTVRLTTHRLLVPRIRISKATNLLPCIIPWLGQGRLLIYVCKHPLKNPICGCQITASPLTCVSHKRKMTDSRLGAWAHVSWRPHASQAT